MAPLTLQSTLKLNTGTSIPLLGFGVWDSPSHLTTSSCLSALSSGYRHVDTAQAYGNELEVGRAVAQSHLPRSSIFVTSKIVQPAEDDESTYRKVLESVTKIGGEGGYLDLMLIHNQACGMEKVRMMWVAMERLFEEGRIKAIGVSNFGVGTIEGMREYASVWPPAVNQLELHPWCQQPEINAYCRKHGIAVEAYCPLVRNQKADDPTLTSIASKHQTSTQQVLLRYCLQKDWIPLPKSDNPGRIAKNADLYGFALDGEDMEKLDGLDQGSEEALVVAVDNKAVE